MVAADQAGNTNYAAAAQVTQERHGEPGAMRIEWIQLRAVDHHRSHKGSKHRSGQLPVPLQYDRPAFATTANGGHVTSSTGNDIIFSTDPNGLTKLDHELEEYNPATGQVIAWVRIPTLSHTVDTVLYVFYGNASITASQQNPTGVWDSNYMGVWHVANNGGQLSLADSTSNGNNATNNGATSTAGQIDGGMHTNGSTYATIGTPASLANLAQGQLTVSAWVNSATGNGGAILGKNGTDGNAGWSLGLDYDNYVSVYGRRLQPFQFATDE